MQIFGETCPMCCGDLGKDGTVDCVFCGFMSAADCSAKDAPGISAWLLADGVKRKIMTRPAALEALSRGLPGARCSLDETTHLVLRSSPRRVSPSPNGRSAQEVI
jgi:hypothetical protein